MELKNADGEVVGFGVQPITNCPHYKEEFVQPFIDLVKELKLNFCNQKCDECNNQGENWICLVCRKVYCSRYVKEHMVQHNQYSNHEIGLSFLDGSFWCYSCDSYITNAGLNNCRRHLAASKETSEDELNQLFGNLNINDKEEKKDEEEELNQEEKKEKEQVEQAEKDNEFTKKMLIDGLKEKKFKKIAVLTGAGISVAAGIPDFRTPGTGLYSQLEKYNLPFPEAIFQLDYFKKNPHPFYTLAKSFFQSDMQPTIAHYLIAEFDKQNILGVNLSQNIDGLELDAGVQEQNLVQAHGHFRTCHCVNKKCYKKYSMDDFVKCVNEDKILKCENCDNLVKPDIVFFGEQLPNDFFKAISTLKQCDLAIVMGTSLTVQPFASLVDLIQEDVPLVLINRENPGISRENFLFLDGDIEENSKNLLQDWGMEVPNVQKKEAKVDDNFKKSLEKELGTKEKL